MSTFLPNPMRFCYRYDQVKVNFAEVSLFRLLAPALWSWWLLIIERVIQYCGIFVTSQSGILFFDKFDKHIAALSPCIEYCECAAVLRLPAENHRYSLLNQFFCLGIDTRYAYADMVAAFAVRLTFHPEEYPFQHGALPSRNRRYIRDEGKVHLQEY